MTSHALGCTARGILSAVATIVERDGGHEDIVGLMLQVRCCPNDRTAWLVIGDPLRKAWDLAYDATGGLAFYEWAPGRDKRDVARILRLIAACKTAQPILPEFS